MLWIQAIVPQFLKRENGPFRVGKFQSDKILAEATILENFSVAACIIPTRPAPTNTHAAKGKRGNAAADRSRRCPHPGDIMVKPRVDDVREFLERVSIKPKDKPDKAASRSEEDNDSRSDVQTIQGLPGDYP